MFKNTRLSAVLAAVLFSVTAATENGVPVQAWQPVQYVWTLE